MQAGKKNKQEQTIMTYMYENDTNKSIALCASLKSCFKKSKIKQNTFLQINKNQALKEVNKITNNNENNYHNTFQLRLYACGPSLETSYTVLNLPAMMCYFKMPL